MAAPDRHPVAGSLASGPGAPGPLAERYRPGEDLRPLLGGLVGGLLGALALLLLDRVWPTAPLATFDPGPETWVSLPPGGLWPALWADAILGDAVPGPAGTALLLVAATLAAWVFVYGQVRRFLPGPTILRGACWGLALWLLVCPFLVPRAAPWLAGAGAAGAPAVPLLPAAIGIWAETLVGLLVYGIVVSLLNPARPDPPATA